MVTDDVGGGVSKPFGKTDAIETVALDLLLDSGSRDYQVGLM